MADAARSTGSLPVANVQALAETCNNGVDEQVPERYLSKDPSAEEVVASDDSTCAIPVIDLRKLLDPESSEEECAKLGSACLNWGFFQVYICIHSRSMCSSLLDKGKDRLHPQNRGIRSYQI
jgi:hypothetical protein